ncbi:FadR family transcriptional regulator [Treponema parvum]|uniref:FadR family transcriptional regulator n=1 Tax=Treponema parvum TaxID=138851 RepID=A0A975F2X4_9SPIR|nr:FadR/GntR family transcriptional regulator [Treponema parvum]QTQ13315.1 FadR family transcriptional regulator [Treponema parvum]
MARKTSTLKKIASKKIADQVFDQLLDQIKAGVWEAGDKLPSENEMASAFNVSRISVREAVKRFAAMGIVETRQGEGSFLKQISLENCTKNILLPLFTMDPPSLLEIIEFRSINEPGAIALAAERITDEELAELERLVTDMKRSDVDIRKFIDDDLKFHLTISKASHNSFIIQMNDLMFEMLRKGMETTVSKLGRKDGIHYHTEILSALKKRNKNKAVELMREHIGVTAERLKEMLLDLHGR